MNSFSKKKKKSLARNRKSQITKTSCDDTGITDEKNIFSPIFLSSLLQEDIGMSTANDRFVILGFNWNFSIN